MRQRSKRAFVMDGDQFLRLSLNRILRKYGFEVEEIEDFADLKGRKRDIEVGMILAEIDPQAFERWWSFLRRWRERLIVMTPMIMDQFKPQLEKMGVTHVLKKPVDPKLLQKVIREIPFPEGDGNHPLESGGVEKRGGVPKKRVILRAA